MFTSFILSCPPSSSVNGLLDDLYNANTKSPNQIKQVSVNLEEDDQALNFIRRDSGVMDVGETGASCKIVGLKTLLRIVGFKSLNPSKSRAVLRTFCGSQKRFQGTHPLRVPT
ncbi:hypothetical protein J6590_078988 [Homalodisca vitripennis]|nr:hypothetical protein J6590_078988 [Homalodisca vitripennis]